jgi:hypothetical protein
MTSPVVIDPNPLFQAQGDTERVVPVIDVDPLTDGSLEGRGGGCHGNPIKRGGRSLIYKKVTVGIPINFYNETESIFFLTTDSISSWHRSFKQ